MLGQKYLSLPRNPNTVHIPILVPFLQLQFKQHGARFL